MPRPGLAPDPTAGSLGGRGSREGMERIPSSPFRSSAAFGSFRVLLRKGMRGAFCFHIDPSLCVCVSVCLSVWSHLKFSLSPLPAPLRVQPLLPAPPLRRAPHSHPRPGDPGGEKPTSFLFFLFLTRAFEQNHL